MKSVKELMPDDKERSESLASTLSNASETKATLPIDDSEQLRELRVAIERERSEKDAALQRCYQLDRQLVELSESGRQGADDERSQWQARVDELLADATSERAASDEKLGELMHDIAHAREQLFKMEMAKDDFRYRAETLAQRVEEYHEQELAWSESREELHRVRDEMQDLRAQAEHAAHLEHDNARLLKGHEDAEALRLQLASLEERHTELLKSKLDLEAERQRSVQLEQQLESYRQLCQELRQKNADAEQKSRADRLEGEKARDRLAASESERRELERRLAKAAEDAANVANEAAATLVGSNQPSDGTSSSGPTSEDANDQAQETDAESPNAIAQPNALSNLMIPFEAQEKLMRLELDNEELRRQLEGVAVTPSIPADDAIDRKRLDNLESENRELLQRSVQLETQLDELRTRPVADSSKDAELLEARKSTIALEKSVASLESLLSGKDETLSLKDALLLERAQELQQARQEAEKRSTQLELLETRLRNRQTAMATAKSPEPDPIKDEDVERLRLQVAEREAEVERQTSELKRLKLTVAQRRRQIEDEQRAMSAAWHRECALLSKQYLLERIGGKATRSTSQSTAASSSNDTTDSVPPPQPAAQRSPISAPVTPTVKSSSPFSFFRRRQQPVSPTTTTTPVTTNDSSTGRRLSTTPEWAPALQTTRQRLQATAEDVLNRSSPNAEAKVRPRF